MSPSDDFITTDQSLRLEKFFSRITSENISIEEVRDISLKTEVPLRKVEYFALSKSIIPYRYQRNIGTFGVSGQMKLFRSTAVIVGLGGLGGICLEQISRAGFGGIIAVDPDVFDQSNLNRQVLSTEDNIGQEKVAVAGKRIQEINSALDFTGYVCQFQDLPDEVWQKADIVFDCLDNIPDRLILAGKCDRGNCPLVHGAIAGCFAEVGVVWPGSKMLETCYQGQTEGMEKELGTPAPTAVLAASIMATKGTQVLTGGNLNKESAMHIFNLVDNEWGVITI